MSAFDLLYDIYDKNGEIVGREMNFGAAWFLYSSSDFQWKPSKKLEVLGGEFNLVKESCPKCGCIYPHGYLYNPKYKCACRDCGTFYGKPPTPISTAEDGNIKQGEEISDNLNWEESKIISPKKSVSWDSFFMSMAYLAAMKSEDKSSKIGAVLVGNSNEIISIGYNGFPRKVNESESERHERPLKYSFYEHGERNSLYNAARIGVSTLGARCYTNGTPCVDCARGLIQAGLKEVIVDSRWEENPFAGNNRQKWLESAIYSKEMFKESGVILRIYRGELITEIKGLFSGQELSLK